MSDPSPLEGLPEVRWTVVAPLGPGGLDLPEATAPAVRGLAQAASGLASAARELGLSRLHRLVVRGPGGASLVALRGQVVLLAALDAAPTLARVEQVVDRWLDSGPAGGGRSPAATGPLGSTEVRTQSVFSGKLAVFALPDLLEFLRGGRRSGRLKIASSNRSATLRFTGGWITGSSSPGSPGLAALLVASGWLTQAEAQALDSSAGPGALDLGATDLLVARGLVPAEPLQQALHQQVEQTLREVVRWRDGHFAFTQEAGDETGAAARVDPQSMLLELYRQQDEASRV
jgi:hypothetical protein